MNMVENRQQRMMLGCFVGSLVVCACIVAICTFMTFMRYSEYSSIRGQIVSSSTSVFETLEDAEFLIASGGTVQSYQSTGKIGKTDRLIWINALEKIAEQLPVDEFHLEISPAEEIQVGALKVHKVNSIVSGSLLHDGLLEVFFSLLVENVSSGYSIRGFEASLQERPDTVGSDIEPRLEFIVELSWYSILLPEDTPLVASL